MAPKNDAHHTQAASIDAQPKIRIVLGDVDLEDLGMTLIHEHVFWDFEPKWREGSITFTKQELEAAAEYGARTVVDVAPHPYRIPEWYQAVASQVSLNLVVSTGFYLENRVTPEIRSLSENQMADWFWREIMVGIRNSSLRAGVIKVAGEGVQLTSWEKKVMRSAAGVQREVGVPICTHAIEGGLSQFEALVGAGADPQRIYISHTEQESGWEGRSVGEQIEYLLEITRQGGSLYFSTFGWDFLSREENLKRLMVTICENGFQDQLLFSADANYKVDEDGNIWWEEQRDHPELPVKNFSHTFTTTLPLLKKWGFTDADIKHLLFENPKAMFSTACF